MSVKTRAVLAVVVITLALAPTIGAQGPSSVPTSQAMRIAAARKANAALMRQYSWTSRTEVIDQGQVKDLRIEAVNYGPGGQLQIPGPVMRSGPRSRPPSRATR